MTWADPYNKEKQKKAINELKDLVKKRRKNEISRHCFACDVDYVETKYRVILGNTFLSKVADLAADLCQNDAYRYYKDEMTRKEEEELLIKNIELLYGKIE